MPRRPHRDADTKVIDSPGRFDEEPMKRADRLFELRSYLGAVDQLNELELTTTKDSSTLVMAKTLYRCHNAGVNDGFARRRQFVRE